MYNFLKNYINYIRKILLFSIFFNSDYLLADTIKSLSYLPLIENTDFYEFQINYHPLDSD